MSFAAVSLHPPNAPIPLYQASQYEGAGVIERKPNRPTSWDDRLKSVSAMVRARGDMRPPSRPVAIHGGATYPPLVERMTTMGPHVSHRIDTACAE